MRELTTKELTTVAGGCFIPRCGHGFGGGFGGGFSFGFNVSFSFGFGKFGYGWC